jgi:hypothetical protein
MGVLHFKFTRMGGVAKVRTKMNVGQQEWSNVFEMWRQPHVGPRECTFTLADMGDCVYRTVSQETLQKIATGIESCNPRSTVGQHASCLLDYEMLSNPPRQKFAWSDGGLFKCESQDMTTPTVEVKVDKKAVTHMTQLTHLREHSRLWSSLARREKEKQDAKKTTVTLTIGDFVAIGMNYDVADHEIPQGQQHSFWVGQVTAINLPADKLVVHWYHTKARQRFIEGKYNVWTVGAKIETVAMGAVWAVWAKLTETRHIPAEVRKVLKYRVDNPDDQDDPHEVVDLTESHWLGCSGNEDSDADDGTCHRAKDRGYGHRKKRQKRKKKKKNNDEDESGDSSGDGCENGDYDSNWERAQAAFKRRWEKRDEKEKQKRKRKR